MNCFFGKMTRLKILHFKVFLLLFLIGWGGSFSCHGQVLNTDSLLQKTQETIDAILFRTHDTNYIKDYSEELALYGLSQIKLNNVGVFDRNNNNSLIYTPESRGFIGIGGSYKYLGLELALNIDPFNNQKVEDRFFDFQASIFTRKDFIEAVLQYYYGYRLVSVTSGLVVPPREQFRDDMRTINLGLQFYHVFNYGKFSLRAPFLMTQHQKKSAGSLIGGANFVFFVLDGDSSIIPPSQDINFGQELQIQDLNVIGLATNWGYIHTFSWWKKFFLTLSIMPGISLNAGDYYSDQRNFISPHITFSTKTMNALGYNSRRLFGGFRFLGDVFAVRTEKRQNILISRGRFKFFAGWRFRNKKSGSPKI